MSNPTGWEIVFQVSTAPGTSQVVLYLYSDITFQDGEKTENDLKNEYPIDDVRKEFLLLQCEVLKAKSYLHY